MRTEFWRGDRRERDDLEDLEVDGDNIEMHIQKMVSESTGCIYMAQDRAAGGHL